MFQKLPDQWSPQLLFRTMIKIIHLIQIDTILKGSFPISRYKVGYVFLMVIVSMRPHAKIGRNCHREGGPHFMSCWAHELLSGNRESFAKLHLRAVYFTLSKSLGVKISALTKNSNRVPNR